MAIGRRAYLAVLVVLLVSHPLLSPSARGPTFLLLCEDDAPESAALRLVAHIERALAEPFELCGEPVTIGSSVGAVISDGELGADELISRADQAMYRVKEQHRAALDFAGRSDRGAP